MKTPVIETLPKDQADLEKSWPQLLSAIVQESRTPAPADEIARNLSQDSSFMDLIRGWDRMPTAAQANAWEMIGKRLWEAVLATRQYCLRCGECCQKGSPVIYDQDRPSLASGAIRRADLMTLRRGEAAWSNQAGKMVVLEREQVKIREAPQSRACIFLGPGGDACLIYSDRPHACRIMECWDPSRYRTVLKLPPVTRLELLGEDNPLSALIQEHESRCGVWALAGMLMKEDEQPLMDQALELVLFDLHVRAFAQEKLSLDPDEMDFFFGRPLARIILPWGYRVETDSDGQPRLEREPLPQPEA